MSSPRDTSEQGETGHEPTRRILDEHFREMALRMVLHCVRNTVIEDYHAAGKLSDSEMSALNHEVVNKLFAFLQIMFNPYFKDVRMKAWAWLYPPQWDKPTFDKDFLTLLKIVDREASPFA